MLNPAPVRGESPGFTLIELIGMMAIAVILAGVLAAVSIRSIDQAYSVREASTLQTYATALQNSILRNHYIPGPNDWYQVIATEAGVSTNVVLLTERRTPRLFLVDPSFQIAGASVPYTQTTNGSPAPPQNLRLMILSSLSGSTTNWPSAVLSSGNFGAIWTTHDGSLPTNGCFSGWNGRSDDLKIQRINLSPLFINLQLMNYLSTNLGQFRIDGQGPVSVPNTTNGFSGYFILNTPLTLIQGATSGGATNAELLLSRDFSFFYVQQFWRDVPYSPNVSGAQTNGAAASLANEIAMAATMFAGSPINTNALAGTTPIQVLNTMSNFMYFYAPYAGWAQTNGWVASGPYYSAAKMWQTNLAAALYNLQYNISQGGCQ